MTAALILLVALAPLIPNHRAALAKAGDPFRDGRARTIAAPVPLAVGIGDVDGDGDLDIASAHAVTFDEILLYFNDGAANFGAPQVAAAPTYDRPMNLTDLNGDGLADLVAASHNEVAIRLNLGGGTFGEPQPFPSLQLADPLPGDFDGDGDTDLVLRRQRNDTYGFEISVLLNRGDGVLDEGHTTPVSIYPADLTAGDMDGDADLDLISSGYDSALGSSALLMLRNEGAGIFVEQVLLAPESSYLASPSVLDLEADGDRDVVLFRSAADSTILVLANRGDGTFDEPRDVLRDRNLSRLLVADMDLDGFEDLISSSMDM